MLFVAKRKFGLDSADEVSVVLEEDGTCVDEDEYFQHGLQSSSVLMLLKSDEMWTGIGCWMGFVSLGPFHCA